MKKFTKIISVVLVIAAMLMTTLLPVFAAFPDDAVAYFWITKERSEEYSDGEHTIYKVTMHLQANYPVSIGDLRVYWPKDEFTLLENEPDPEWPCDDASMAFNYLGAMADNTRYRRGSGRPEINDGNILGGSSAYGPGQSDLTPVYPINAKNYNDAVPQSVYTGIQLAWIMGNSNHYYYDSSVWGDEVAEFYLLQHGDASIDDVQTKEAAPLHEVCWSGLDANDTEPSPESMAAKGHGTLFKTLIFGEPSTTTSGPKVEREKGQIKMTATGDGTVADEFQFRVLSKISDADWKTYLANTGSSEDNNCLTKLGFVAYKGTEDFDMAQAQAAAKAGETQGNYYVATTNYVKHTDGSDAEFAARIDTSKTTCDDATYIAFIQYKDADGTEQYAFYDAEYTALIKTNYDLLVSQYLGQFGN